MAIYGGFLGIDETLLTDRNPEDNTTILTGALTTGYYFPDCGDPGAGPCDSANGTPGCEDATCCQTVCAVMPDCCDDQFGWVQACVDLAEADRCENCGVPDAGPCDEENGTPGCEDAVCCSLVCEQLPFCCVNPWSEQCKDQADQCYAPTSQAGTIVTATGVSISAVLNGFTISDGGGGLQGAGILIESASPLIVRCTLTANDAVCSDPKNPQGDEGQGGAIHIGGNSSPTLINCSFIANTACEGAALHTEASGTDIAEATLINCLFAGNTSSAHGGAIDAGGFDAANLRIINCTFVNNTADDGGGPEQGGGAIYNHRGGTVTITNSILWNNYPDEIKIPVGDPSPVVVSFSDVEGGVLGEGNIDIDPSFCDPDAGVFRLRPDSACLDAGSDAAVPLDYSDLDDNGQFCEPLPWDLDALPRFFDALASTSDVDMGAYESHVAGTCPWDCGNSDGDVGIFDFLELLDQWGDPGLCDFDGDGVVGIIDFLLLLASWGACPDTECVASLTIQQELALHCLDQADWDLHEAVMTDPTSSQLKKDRYHCWMRHYLYDCDYCSCSTALCPGKDPFR